jgi:hypothetical protein
MQRRSLDWKYSPEILLQLSDVAEHCYASPLQGSMYCFCLPRVSAAPQPSPWAEIFRAFSASDVPLMHDDQASRPGLHYGASSRMILSRASGIKPILALLLL